MKRSLDFQKYDDINRIHLSDYLGDQSIFQKTFNAEALMKTTLKTFVQIFTEFMLKFKVVMESILGPDDTCERDLQA